MSSDDITERAGTIDADPLLGRQRSLVPIRESGNTAPLFVVHGGGGGVGFLEPLVAHLDPRIPLYGLQAEGFDGIPGPQRSVEELASRYLAEIRARQPDGPYHLAGLCFGGAVAYAMAQELSSVDRAHVASLTLIDSRDVRSDSRWERVRRDSLGATVVAFVRAVGRKLALPFKRWVIERRIRRGKPLPDRFGIRQVHFFPKHDRAGREYERDPYDGELKVIAAAGTSDEHRRLWAWLAGEGCEINEVGTPSHSGLIHEPHVGEVARLLARHVLAATEIHPG